MPGHWLVKIPRVFTGTLEELVVNREEGKKPKQYQPHHRLDSFHFLSAKWAELFQVTTKQEKNNHQAIKDWIPRSVWERKEMEQSPLF